ncbi:MAG: type II toxin-antitoxin system RelE/ParE family toxin [Rubrivivax sp.]|nr:type II toxin-antitoxin system RelE/ParE family toxin [Rubrivivax sp.]
MPVRLIVRAAAQADVQAAADWYVDEGGGALGLRFLAELDAAYRRIAREPGIGSPRWAEALNLPDLRVWPLARFPYLVFYQRQAQHVEVWRVLHSGRDVPGALTGPQGRGR